MNLKISFCKQVSDVQNDINNKEPENFTLNFSNGINFLKTTRDNKIFKILAEMFDENDFSQAQIFFNDKKTEHDILEKLSCSINNYEMSGMRRKKKLRSLIKAHDDITQLFEITQQMLSTRTECLWHNAYLCLCAAGISKGKKIFLFPWIPCKECFIQSYRFGLITRYAQSNDIIAIIPTDSLTYNGMNIECAYNITNI